MSYRDKEYKYIIVKVEDGIAVVTFNRPEALNAVNFEMMQERSEVYAELAVDPEVKVVVSTGNERAYCAGGDLKAFANYSVKEARDFADGVVAGSMLVYNMSKPTIASIAGVCMGGGMESILNHDLKIAADNAKFALPEINVGIYPGGGATQRLPQLISLSKVKELIFFGEPFDAQTALELGIINKVVPLAELQEETMKWAKKLVKKPPFSLRMAKEAINCAWSSSLQEGFRHETHGWAMCYGTQDQKEGMAAFIEKRKPNFTGN
jgi:enoyl-CoA hydratase